MRSRLRGSKGPSKKGSAKPWRRREEQTTRRGRDVLPRRARDPKATERSRGRPVTCRSNAKAPRRKAEPSPAAARRTKLACASFSPRRDAVPPAGAWLKAGGGASSARGDSFDRARPLMGTGAGRDRPARCRTSAEVPRKKAVPSPGGEKNKAGVPSPGGRVAQRLRSAAGAAQPRAAQTQRPFEKRQSQALAARKTNLACPPPAGAWPKGYRAQPRSPSRVPHQRGGPSKKGRAKPWRREKQTWRVLPRRARGPKATERSRGRPAACRTSAEVPRKKAEPSPGGEKNKPGVSSPGGRVAQRRQNAAACRTSAEAPEKRQRRALHRREEQGCACPLATPRCQVGNRRAATAAPAQGWPGFAATP